MARDVFSKNFLYTILGGDSIEDIFIERGPDHDTRYHTSP